MSSFEKTTLKDPASVWHRRFGHLAPEAIQKIEEATEGAVVTTSEVHERNIVGFEEKCEVCAISNPVRKYAESR